MSSVHRLRECANFDEAFSFGRRQLYSSLSGQSHTVLEHLLHDYIDYVQKGSGQPQGQFNAPKDFRTPVLFQIKLLNGIEQPGCCCLTQEHTGSQSQSENQILLDAGATFKVCELQLLSLEQLVENMIKEQKTNRVASPETTVNERGSVNEGTMNKLL